MTIAATANIPPLSILSSDVVFNRELNLIDFRVLTLLSAHANKKLGNLAWVSVAKMGSLLSESRTRVYESLDKLQREGLIRDTGQRKGLGAKVWEVIRPSFDTQSPPPNQAPSVPQPPPVSENTEPVSNLSQPVSNLDTQTENRKTEKNNPLPEPPADEPKPTVKSDERAGVVVSLPDVIPDKLKRPIIAMLRGAPEDQRQHLVDELAYRIENSKVRNALGYFGHLVKLAVQGLFFPVTMAVEEKDESQKAVREAIDIWCNANRGRDLEGGELERVEAIIEDFYRSIGRSDWAAWRGFV